MVSGFDFETNPLIGEKMGDLPRAMVRFYEEKMMGIVIYSLGDFINDFVAGNGPVRGFMWFYVVLCGLKLPLSQLGYTGTPNSGWEIHYIIGGYWRFIAGNMIELNWNII